MSIPVIGGPGFNGPGAEDDPMVSDGKIHVLFQLMTVLLVTISPQCSAKAQL